MCRSPMAVEFRTRCFCECSLARFSSAQCIAIYRVTASPPADDFFWVAILQFLAQYPEISLDLSFNEALTDIVAERFDAGIRQADNMGMASDIPMRDSPASSFPLWKPNYPS
jgi:DNA-binding transcriptional LysR family regulator